MRAVTMKVQVPNGGQFRVRRFGKKSSIHEATFEIETRVFVARKLLNPGVGTSARVEVEAFIPEKYRHPIPGKDPRWVSAGVLRTTAYIHTNRRTLAPLLDSDLHELRFPEESAAA